MNKYYKDIIILQPNYLELFKKEIVDYDNINRDFNMLNKCLYLVRYIAEKQNKDLSIVDYNPIVKKLYKFIERKVMLGELENSNYRIKEYLETTNIGTILKEADYEWFKKYVYK